MRSDWDFLWSNITYYTVHFEFLCLSEVEGEPAEHTLPTLTLPSHHITQTTAAEETFRRDTETTPHWTGKAEHLPGSSCPCSIPAQQRIKKPKPLRDLVKNQLLQIPSNCQTEWLLRVLLLQPWEEPPAWRGAGPALRQLGKHHPALAAGRTSILLLLHQVSQPRPPKR